MSSPILAPPPREILPEDHAPVVVRRARPVLSPARPAPRTGRGPIGLSLLVHLVVVSALFLLLRLGPALGPGGAPGEAPGPTAEVEYIDLDFPTAGSSPTGIPAAPPPAAASAPATSAGSVVRPRRPEEEPLRFPRMPSGGPAEAPSGAMQPGAGAVGAEAGGAAGGDAGESGGQAGGGGSVSDRLRPGYRDPRLYVDQKIEQLKEVDTRSDIQKYRERLQAAIQASNDSAWAQGSHPNTDWTKTDRNGRKWGVDEKGVYLGGIRIPKALVPTPRATGTNKELEAERQRQKQHDEIQRQEDAAARKKAQDEAIKETRARKEAEREKGADGGTR
jgi:hypothetical protein